ncbi:MAG: ribonuclease HII, partial [Candidatus Thorarchaeota archaeon]|nr:ribonuclease HII [Candidatus Thorarchaeota archaeon]
SGVKDSKALTAKRREEYAKVIRKVASKIVVEQISAIQIDTSRSRGTNLNETEVNMFATIAKKLNPTELYMDAADVNSKRFGDRIRKKSGLLLKECKIVSEHKADSKYVVVSAASIIAKTERDAVIKKLHGQYGDFGSGYPTDPKSIAFLKKLIHNNEELPFFVRRSWESVSRAVREGKNVQSKLDY